MATPLSLRSYLGLFLCAFPIDELALSTLNGQSVFQKPVQAGGTALSSLLSSHSSSTLMLR